MDLQSFLDRCERYCDRTEMSRSRLSTILFGSGVTIDRLREGRGITVRVLERAVERMNFQETQQKGDRRAEAAA